MAEQANGNNNALAALKKIRESEEKARKIILDAMEEVNSGILPQAHQKAKDKKEKSLEEARSRAKKNKEQVIRNAQKEAEKIGKDAKDEIRELRRQMEQTLPAAVERVAEKIEEMLKKGFQ
jgi:vacuolar-type H+-ATPase subunit H